MRYLSKSTLMKMRKHELLENLFNLELSNMQDSDREFYLSRISKDRWFEIHNVRSNTKNMIVDRIIALS